MAEADHPVAHSDPIDTAAAVRRLMASNHPAIRAIEVTADELESMRQVRLAWKPPTADDVAMMWRTRSARTAADELESMRQARLKWKKHEKSIDVLYQAVCDSELVTVVDLPGDTPVGPTAALLPFQLTSWEWQETPWRREMILGGKVRASAGDRLEPYAGYSIFIKGFQNWLDHCTQSEPPEPTGNPAPDEASAIPVKAVAETERRAQAPDEAASCESEPPLKGKIAVAVRAIDALVDRKVAFDASGEEARRITIETEARKIAADLKLSLSPRIVRLALAHRKKWPHCK